MVLPGAPLTFTATPKTGFVFSHWTGAPAGAVTLGNVLSFPMPQPPEQMPTITAYFVATVFGGPALTGTNFYGLIHPDGAGESNYHTQGFFTGSLTAATGAFTGKVQIDGVSTAVTATFYGNGDAVFRVGSVLSSSLTVGSHTLTMSYDTVARDTIAVHLDGGDTNDCSGTAERAYNSTARKVSSTLLNQTTKGFFTFVLPRKEQSPAKDHSLYPQGFGHGTITLSDLGVITVAGSLADGTPITASSALVTANSGPFFAQLTVSGSTTGVLCGELVFDKTQPNTDVTAPGLVWIRPTTTAALYTDGWPTGIQVDLSGALYSVADTAQTSLALGAVNNTFGNAELLIGDGKLSPSLDITTFNISGNTFTPLSVTDKRCSLLLNTSTSLSGFYGSFRPNWTPLATTDPVMKGIILQKGNLKGGYGYFISNKPGDTDPESGGVMLQAQD
jgi:hypothetical protein